MANPNLDDLQRRARAAYERGRWQRACIEAWPVLGLGGLAIAFGSRPGLAAVLAAILLVSVVVLGHRGGAWRRAIVPGLVAGSLPMVVGLSACHIPHVCGGSVCMSWCMPFVGVAALLGGMVLARRAARSRPELLISASIASLTGAMGCIAIGLGGPLGLAAGMALSTGSALVTARAR
jgi:hypothetical protein